MYDLIVLGGGSGGIAAARKAAQLKARVALVDPDPHRLGGTCVNRGCVPKKLFWYHHLNGDNNWKEFKEKRDNYIKRLNGIYAENLKRDGVHVVQGYGKFINNKGVMVAGTLLQGERVLIATGSHPILPVDTPGYQLGITSDEFFELQEQPKRVGIIGSGYVGVELAGILRGFGSEVDMFVRTDSVLTHFDSMVQEVVLAHYRSIGIKIHTGCPISALTKDGGKILVHSCKEEPTAVDCVIWAIGRGPNKPYFGKDMNESALKVDAEQRVLDKHGKPIEGLYAVGDVTGQRMLTPVAIAVGRQLAAKWFAPGGSLLSIAWECIPSVLFTHPPAGTVGLTETEARSKHASISVYEASFTSLQFALSPANDAIKTRYKLICDSEDRILGLHMYGPGSDEALQGFAVAIQMGAKKGDFDRTIAIHPTSTEELVLLRQEPRH